MNTQDKSIIILGAGIAGISAGFTFKAANINPIIFEKDGDWGGLCSNFSVNNFRFDRFIHLSFSDNEYVNDLFLRNTPYIRHIPNPYNLYKGKWIKHPAQNNLFPLSEQEKEIILKDMEKRGHIEIDKIANYEQWLRVQYGDYFAENFPMRYTRKYWQTEACNLETKWIGNRMYRPTYEEVKLGCKTDATPITYYAKEMRYPEKGGFRSFLNPIVNGLDIRCNCEIIEIDHVGKIVKDNQGNQYKYDYLLSSIPLPELVKITKNVPQDVYNAAKMLKCTSGYQLSIGLKGKNITPYLWFYIYDEDIPAARVYSPSIKSSDNVSENCSSLQLEIYCEKDQYSRQMLIDLCLSKLSQIGVFKLKDILFTDLRFEKYANVIFDHNIYRYRRIVRDYFDQKKIFTIGRFGEWEYFWSDQSLLSGRFAAESILKKK